MDEDVFSLDSHSDEDDIEVPLAKALLVSKTSAHPSVTISSKDTKPTEFGRKEECSSTTQFSDRRISRLYCTVYMQGIPSKLYVRDMSVNGTYINGVRLPRGQAMILEHGDVLSLSREAIIVKYDAPDKKDDGAEDQATFLVPSSASSSSTLSRLQSSILNTVPDDVLLCISNYLCSIDLLSACRRRANATGGSLRMNPTCDDTKRYF